MRAYNFNKNREWSQQAGGAKQVYGLKAEITLPTGYSVPLDEMPPVGQVLPAGTPFEADDYTKVAIPHYAFAVHSPAEAAATTVQVFKGFEGTRARVGMVIMHLPNDAADVTVTGTGIEITAIDDTNENYDILTLGTALPAALAQGDILVEASETGASATIKVVPTATSYADIPSYGDEQWQGVDLVHICNVIYTRRCAPIHPVIRTYMAQNGYFVRFYNGV